MEPARRPFADRSSSQTADDCCSLLWSCESISRAPGPEANSAMNLWVTCLAVPYGPGHSRPWASTKQATLLLGEGVIVPMSLPIAIMSIVASALAMAASPLAHGRTLRWTDP